MGRSRVGQTREDKLSAAVMAFAVNRLIFKRLPFFKFGVQMLDNERVSGLLPVSHT